MKTQKFIVLGKPKVGEKPIFLNLETNKDKAIHILADLALKVSKTRDEDKIIFTLIGVFNENAAE